MVKSLGIDEVKNVTGAYRGHHKREWTVALMNNNGVTGEIHDISGQCRHLAHEYNQTELSCVFKQLRCNKKNTRIRAIGYTPSGDPMLDSMRKSSYFMNYPYSVRLMNVLLEIKGIPVANRSMTQKNFNWEREGVAEHINLVRRMGII